MLDIKKENTALVIVDMQNDFVRVGAAMEVPDARKTIPIIQKLISYAHKNDIPVIFTKFVTGSKPILLWTWSPQIPSSNCCRLNFKRFFKEEGKELEVADVISELMPQKQDYIIEKYWYSAFHNSRLADILLSEGKDSIIVAGTVTQICVEDTVHDAFHLGLKTIVASDGVSSFDDELHAAALKNFEMKYADVMTADQIIKRLG